jgi:hypothetical protein
VVLISASASKNCEKHALRKILLKRVNQHEALSCKQSAKNLLSGNNLLLGEIQS